jgi:hypothetical protein
MAYLDVADRMWLGLRAAPSKNSSLACGHAHAGEIRLAQNPPAFLQPSFESLVRD